MLTEESGFTDYWDVVTEIIDVFSHTYNVCLSYSHQSYVLQAQNTAL